MHHIQVIKFSLVNDVVARKVVLVAQWLRTSRYYKNAASA